MARILIIDDEVLVREFLRGVLESAGHDVMEGTNGEDAVSIFSKFLPDVLIIDVIMPDQDGLYAIRVIRREMPKAKLIAMSGMHTLVGYDYLRPALKLGADVALYKPFGSKVLLHTIQDLLSARDDPWKTAQ
jgi:two-component system, chemotaxis family, chemotaxis protein CheY